MSKDSINEMEQIQKGLEEFLRQEIEGYHDDIRDTKDRENGVSMAGNFVGEGPGHTIEKEAADSEDFSQIAQDNAVGPGGRAAALKAVSPPNKGKNRQRDSSHGAKDPASGSGRPITSGNKQDRRNGSDRPNDAVREMNVKKKKRGGAKSAQVDTGNKAKGMNTKVIKAKGMKTKGMKTKGIKNGRKKSGFRKFLFIVVLLALLTGAGWYTLVGSIYGKMKYEEITSLTDASMKEEGVINILLIGNDSRSQGEDGRSDAMILLSVSSRTKTIHMTSLLRDIYVEIPGYKGNRLNAAYSYGGPELLMETIEKNLDISINRYVLVNFQAFANLVDAVGGVDLELTSKEVEYVNGYLVEYNILEGRPEGTDYLDTSLSGMVHLNGPQALAYSRNRYLGTDFGRTERQRKILSAVIDRLPGAVIKNPAGLMDGLLPNLTTNLTKGECLNLSLQAGKLLAYEMIQGSIPVEGSYSNANIRGMDVLQIDFDMNKEYIRSNIYGE